MAEPRLVIECEGYDEYKLYWFFPDEGDMGGELERDTEQRFREHVKRAMGAPEDKRELALSDLDHVAACLAATSSPGVEINGRSLCWRNKKDAANALRLAKAAIKVARSEALGGRPWPEWAVKAQAAGWKAPKGWKP